MTAIPIRIIDGASLRRLLPYTECIEVVRRAMIAVSSGKAHLPLRHGMQLPASSGMLGMMPGALLDPPCFGIKLVSLFPDNRTRGLSSHLGSYLLYESESGQPLALMNASELTAIRTAAASAVATTALMRRDSTTLTIVGTGEQARAHVLALLACHPFRQVLVWGRHPPNARRLVDELAAVAQPAKLEAIDDIGDAVKRADVVCTVTSASEPVLRADLIKPGTHLNLVGSSFPDRREVDDATVVRGRYFVDFRGSALAQAGELLGTIKAGLVTTEHIVAEIGEVLAGNVAGRRSADDLTIYKSLGIAAQDLAAAWHVYQKAERDNLGVVATL